ncbi:hypothetical protein KIN20_005558 [Parelaphostrongylus tenuis]|uniref:Uncharacterized protein n=1 Tax=Parelaphostrongylus tenuis TaxID=148309 RepID=A0AAD5QHL9_PARTN|nr:hypothetical protein KIN20_005558 [Parelaphostrongylus tenuis]
MENDYDAILAYEDGDGGDAEDEGSWRGTLRAGRRRRWRMIRNHGRRTNESAMEPGPSPSRDVGSEVRETDATSTDDENEGPRKRLKRNIGEILAADRFNILRN